MSANASAVPRSTVVAVVAVTTIAQVASIMGIAALLLCRAAGRRERPPA